MTLTCPKCPLNWWIHSSVCLNGVTFRIPISNSGKHIVHCQVSVYRKFSHNWVERNVSDDPLWSVWLQFFIIVQFPILFVAICVTTIELFFTLIIIYLCYLLTEICLLQIWWDFVLCKNYLSKSWVLWKSHDCHAERIFQNDCTEGVWKKYHLFDRDLIF